jgi:hypothetical protein
MEKEIALVLNYLDKIGEKLGVGANMLWPYLMKQQMIEGIVSLCFVPIMFAICFLTWKNEDRLDEVYPVAVFGTAIFGLVSLAHFAFHGLFQLVNTEYMAFQAAVELLKQVK